MIYNSGTVQPNILMRLSECLFFFGLSSLVQFLYMPATVGIPVC